MIRSHLRPAHGQSMAEYLLLLALVTTLVAVPIDGAPSALALLLHAVRVAWDRFFTALALAT
jgi:hypothetical protein